METYPSSSALTFAAPRQEKDVSIELDFQTTRPGISMENGAVVASFPQGPVSISRDLVNWEVLTPWLGPIIYIDLTPTNHHLFYRVN